MIEVLITMFVVAVGLLGAAGLQLASTRFQQTSVWRTQAMQQADAIIEKIRVNSNNLTLGNLATAVATPASAYLAADAYAAAGVLPADPSCGLNGQPDCTAAQSAQRDLREWRQMLAQELPGGRGAIFPVAAGGATEPNARRVVVMWIEKAQFENATDADLGGVNRQDDNCPAPRVDGVRCLNFWVTP